MSDYALEGPKWSTSTLTWSFAPAGGTVTNAITGAYQSTIEAAIARWAQVVNLTITQVPVGTPGVDVTIGWGTFSGGQVGETDYSYQPGANETFLPGMLIRLEDPAALPIGTAATADYQGTVTNLYQLMLHEFGHALGLGISTDPADVMHLTLGPSDLDLDASDIAGVQALYGTPGSGAAVTNAAAAPVVPATINLPANEVAVYRFFDTSNGTQFLTGSVAERNTVLATRSDLSYEGLAMAAIAPGSDPAAVPVYRFFDASNGTHFFTASQAEETAILASRPDLMLEQTTFYEHSTRQSGDTPVYRFFDASNGTHFFTASTTEQAAIAATRPDMAYEGIAFWAPSAG